MIIRKKHQAKPRKTSQGISKKTRRDLTKIRNIETIRGKRITAVKTT